MIEDKWKTERGVDENVTYWILSKPDVLIGYWFWSQDKPIFVIGSNMIKIYKDSSVKCQSRCGNMRRYNIKSKI